MRQKLCPKVKQVVCILSVFCDYVFIGTKLYCIIQINVVLTRLRPSYLEELTEVNFHQIDVTGFGGMNFVKINSIVYRIEVSPNQEPTQRKVTFGHEKVPV